MNQTNRTYRMRTSYRKQIDQLDGHVTTMGRATVDDIVSATEAVCHGDLEAAHDVIDGHVASDRLNRSVEDTCMGLMLLQQPLAGDLRLVTSAFRAISDLARIDEMSDEIALLAVEDDVCRGVLSDELDELASQAARMVGQAIDAFHTGDVASAEGVFALDDTTDDLYDRVRSDVVQLLRDGGEPASAAPELLTIAKYYERMGDHAQSIADWAIFRATGAYRGRQMGETS